MCTKTSARYQGGKSDAKTHVDVLLLVLWKILLQFLSKRLPIHFFDVALCSFDFGFHLVNDTLDIVSSDLAARKPRVSVHHKHCEHYDCKIARGTSHRLGQRVCDVASIAPLTRPLARSLTFLTSPITPWRSLSFNEERKPLSPPGDEESLSYIASAAGGRKPPASMFKLLPCTCYISDPNPLGHPCQAISHQIVVVSLRCHDWTHCLTRRGLALVHYTLGGRSHISHWFQHVVTPGTQSKEHADDDDRLARVGMPSPTGRLTFRVGPTLEGI